MIRAFNETLCAGCNKKVPVAPGVCVVCGHAFGDTQQVLVVGTPKLPITVRDWQKYGRSIRINLSELMHQ